MESLLIITGTMGAGKTAVLAEASDILAQRRIVHAAIDLDTLNGGYFGSQASSDQMMYENFKSIDENYAALGIEKMLLARAFEDEAQLRRCRDIVAAPNSLVCRLTARLEVSEQRVAMREKGMLRSEFVARVADLNAVLDRVRLEDFAVVNENRGLTEVALEMLVKAGWIAG